MTGGSPVYLSVPSERKRASPITIRRVRLHRPAENVSRDEPLLVQLAGRQHAYLDRKREQMAKVGFEPLTKAIYAVAGPPLGKLTTRGTLRAIFEAPAPTPAAAVSPPAGTGIGGWEW